MTDEHDGETPLEITFPNGNRARAVHAGARTPVAALTAALGITGPRPVLLVIGGADGLRKSAEPNLRTLMEFGVLPAVERAGAVVVDGGTAAGVMAVVGESIGAAHVQVTLLGVAPAGRVTWPGDTRSDISGTTELEPNHTHFILADSDEWGGETPLLLEAVEVIADPSSAVAVVAGGGPVALREVASAVHRGIPVIALAGTGGLADDLVAGAAVRGGTRTPEAEDTTLTTVLTEIDLTIVPLDATPALLERLLLRRLQPDETLRAAWRQYRILARTARRERRSFVLFQLVILSLGLLATLLVVIQAQLRTGGVLVEGSIGAQALQYAIVLIPIAIGVLVAGTARLRPGGRWVLLRGAAETIKRETYRYRARTGVYALRNTRRTPREVKLASAVGSTMNALMLTDVNLAAIDDRRQADEVTATATASDEHDDGARPLGPSEYIRFRIDDQIDFYRRGVRTRERWVRWLRWLMLVFGGLGTFLAVVGLQLWVAVALALVGALTTYVEATQLESTIMLYNQAATNLETIKAWWTALPPSEQVRRQNADRLVERSERVMQSEHTGWVQEMQDAMTKLHLEEGDLAATDEAPADDDTPAADGDEPAADGDEAPEKPSA